MILINPDILSNKIPGGQWCSKFYDQFSQDMFSLIPMGAFLQTSEEEAVS